MEAILSFDQAALLFIQEHLRSDFLDPIMIFITNLGNAGIIWIVLGIIMLFFKKTRRGGFIMLICVAVSWIINDLVIKLAVSRDRPFNAIDELLAIVAHPRSYSFPSGHTNASFAAAMALTLVYGKKGAWSYIPAALIAFSRCYVGVHYPTDVFFGMIVGSLVSFGTCKLIGYIERLRAEKKTKA